MLTALTGTPGTGKSSIAALLSEQGFVTCRLNELAERSGARIDYDLERRTWNVDLDILQRAIPRERPLIMVGHLSHFLPSDVIIITRCHPETLRKRLQARGWPRRKVEENIEAEALGVITEEAIDSAEVFEVDTTSAPPEESVKAVTDILAGKGEAHRAGSIDWSEVILDWY